MTQAAQHEFLIVGAGPGGLQLAHFLRAAGRDVLVLEAAPRVGDFFRRMPRGRRLISFNKTRSVFDDPEIRLRWDWNSLLTTDGCLPFAGFSQELLPHADDLVRYLEAYAERLGLPVRTSTAVARIDRDEDGRFVLDAADGRRFTAPVLVLATGFARPYVPDVPGLAQCAGYEDAPFDPAAYDGQRVLVVGKGNSALEVADVALPTAALVHVASPTPIQLAWRTRHPGHLRAPHTGLLDMYQLKTLHGALDCVVEEIRREGEAYVVRVAYVHADGETEELVYDRVVRCTGFRMDTAPFAPACRPPTTLDGRLPDVHGMWESTGVPDLFFAGTLMQTRDFKRSSSAFIDGFRYNVRGLARHLLERYAGVPWPRVELPATVDALAGHLLARVDRTSGLWTQFGSLCDLCVVDGTAGTARVTEEIPLAHVQADLLPDLAQAFTLTFEWGPWDGDVFAIERHPRHTTAHTNVFLHPVLRAWRGGELVATHHVLEDLFGTYTAGGEPGVVRRRGGRDMATYHREEHVEPLRAFLAGQLGAG